MTLRLLLDDDNWHPPAVYVATGYFDLARQLARWCLNHGRPHEVVTDQSVGERIERSCRTAGSGTFDHPNYPLAEAVARFALAEGWENGADADRVECLWRLLQPGNDAPLALFRSTPVARATAHFPVRVPSADPLRGAVLRLTAHRLPSDEGPVVQLAPWSTAHPLAWTTFAANFRTVGWDVIRRLAPDVPSTGGERYLLQFDPTDPNSFSELVFDGTSFGFAAVLAVAASRLGVELSRVVVTGELNDSSRPTPVRSLQAKVMATHEAGQRLQSSGPVSFYCPQQDPDPTVALATFFNQRQHGNDVPFRLAESVEVIPVGSWQDFTARQWPRLHVNPFARYLAALRANTGVRASSLVRYTPDDGRVSLTEFGKDPQPTALALADQWEEDDRPELDRPVPMFLDLSLQAVNPPPADCDGVLRGIEATHITHELPPPDPTDELARRLRSRSRLRLIVFTSQYPPNDGYANVAERVAAVARVTGELPLAFVARSRSHAEMIRRTLARLKSTGR